MAARADAARRRARCASTASSARCGPATRAPASTATCSSSRTACCRPRSARPPRCRPPASSPRCSCRRCPAHAVAQGHRRRARPGAVLRRDGQAAARPGCPATTSRSSSNLDFLDGTRGAHVNISGISRRRHQDHLRHLPALLPVHTPACSGAEALNTKALIFNVKGEDLLFLDHPNTALDRRRARPLRRARACPPGRSRSVGVVRPAAAGRPRRPRPTSPVAHRAASRRSSGPSRSSAADELLPFLFADAEDDRQQYTMVVHNVTARLGGRRAAGGRRRGDASTATTVAHVPRPRRRSSTTSVDDDDADGADWAGRAIGAGTINAFVRRLHGAVRHLEPPDPGRRRRPPSAHRVDLEPARSPSSTSTTSTTGPSASWSASCCARRSTSKERSGQAAPAAVRRARRAQQVRAPRGLEPDQGDPARRRRAGPLARHHPHRRAADGQRGRAAHRRQLAPSGSSAGSTRPRPAAASTASCPPVQRQRATIIKPGTMIVSPARAARAAGRRVPVPGLGHPRRPRPAPTRRPTPTSPTIPFDGLLTREAAPHRRLARRQGHPRAAAAADEHEAVLAEIAAVADAEQPSTWCSSPATCSTPRRPRPRPSASSTGALLGLAGDRRRPVVVVAGNHDNARRLAAVAPAARRWAGCTLRGRCSPGPTTAACSTLDAPAARPRDVALLPFLRSAASSRRRRAHGPTTPTHHAGATPSACAGSSTHLTERLRRRRRQPRCVAHAHGRPAARSAAASARPTRSSTTRAGHRVPGRPRTTWPSATCTGPSRIAGAVPDPLLAARRCSSTSARSTDAKAVLRRRGRRRARRRRCARCRSRRGRRLRTLRGHAGRARRRWPATTGDDHLRVVVDEPARAGLADEVRALLARRGRGRGRARPSGRAAPAARRDRRARRPTSCSPPTWPSRASTTTRAASPAVRGAARRAARRRPAMRPDRARGRGLLARSASRTVVDFADADLFALVGPDRRGQVEPDRRHRASPSTARCPATTTTAWSRPVITPGRGRGPGAPRLRRRRGRPTPRCGWCGARQGGRHAPRRPGSSGDADGAAESLAGDADGGHRGGRRRCSA